MNQTFAILSSQFFTATIYRLLPITGFLLLFTSWRKRKTNIS